MAVMMKNGKTVAGSTAGQGGTSEAPQAAKPGWMKQGKAAQEALKQEDEKAQKKQEEMGKMWRYYLGAGKEGKITFLDGKLDADGVLDPIMFLEHQVYMNGSWRNWFGCTKEEEPCPICEGGNDSSLMAVFTIIDHSSYTAKNNITYKDTRKLFVCKRNTFKMLQKKATKQGGLAGCTFDVSRTGEKDPSVGNDFDFVEKRGKAALIEAYPHLKDEMGPAKYEEEIPYYTAAQLREMGFGGKVIGNEKAPAEHAPANQSNLDDEL